jgi:DNA-binding NtrC family response regulator
MIDTMALATSTIPPTDAVVAIVDPNAASRRGLRQTLESRHYRVLEFEHARHLLRHQAPTPDAVCASLALSGDIDAIELLRRVQLKNPDLPVVMIADDADLQRAVESMKAGAYDYIAWPVDPDRLVHAVRRACQMHVLFKQVVAYGVDRGPKSDMVGDSPAMREVDRQIERVLDSDVTVCVFGASGTGKELVAQAIHQRGHRKHGPFVAINCAAVPSSLQESELFGHERGAFTGATGMRQGRFEQAHGGTLFLDELGEMSAETQASLLRTLQEKTIRRVGGSRDIEVDVRIVCATHRNLEAEVAAGRFREDLFFRLVVYPIQLPPLAQRKVDIPELVAHFIRQLNEDVPERVRGVSSPALDALMAYHWPGNVRELRNVIHRAMLSTTREEVGMSDLPSTVRRIVLPSLPPSISMAPAMSIPPPPDSSSPGAEVVTPLRELERREILKALRVTEGSVGQAAKLLGIGRATLYRRLAKLELDPEDLD